MFFNSGTFLLFLPIAFTAYWLLNKKLVSQNILLLLASYVFYGWWDWRFLSLIAFSTIVDYISGLKIQHSGNNKSRKIWLSFSIISNIGVLSFFKYCNFFIDSWIMLIETIGLHSSLHTLNIILPLGISFYTFQTMSYTIDVYKRKIEATNNLISFATYVSFFPQLIAGPIERASSLLSQINTERNFKYQQTVEGMRLILWGMFKKVVIADSLAIIVDQVFARWGSYSGTSILFSSLFFGIQIYCDFSGYSDIAIGISKLFGIELQSNFRFPYFSKNIVDFWRRWHISLSSWFRDYIYIPLGGSRRNNTIAARNILIVFGISGFWHGAGWTFILWGVVHAIFYLSYLYASRLDIFKNILARVFTTLTTFAVVNIAWLLFRSSSIEQAYLMLKKIVLFAFTPLQVGKGLWYVAAILIIDFWIRKNERNPVPIKNRSLRYLYYSALIITIALHWKHDGVQQFIYFQF